jgi:hypothetical protein
VPRSIRPTRSRRTRRGSQGSTSASCRRIGCG